DCNAPIASAIVSRARAAKGDLDGAALELIRARTEQWPFGFEALDLLERAITDATRPPRAGSIALAYGVAARLRDTIDHPRVRRTLTVAAAQSGWDTIGVAGNAGQEHLLSSQPILPPAPAVVIREALLAPSWPVRSANTLTFGSTAVLDVTLPKPTTV